MTHADNSEQFNDVVATSDVAQEAQAPPAAPMPEEHIAAPSADSAAVSSESVPGDFSANTRNTRRVARAKRVAYDAVLTALALSLFVVEMQIPLPLPIPGVKLGLSNIVSLFAMFAMGPIDAAVILLVRIGLGSLFGGSVMSFLYSLAGGVLCYGVTFLFFKLTTAKQIWVAGVFGAVSHVTAQIGVAVAVTATMQVLYYLPILAAIAIVTGGLTGGLSQLVYMRTAHLTAPLRRQTRKKWDNHAA